ncbi:MAG TPA: hypothetical protein VKB58_00955 [Terriglobales bacterium]|nr:hypothetical protein [Terriglobales bacterium]
MATAATWLIIAGVLLLISGVALRTVLMMRSSDATPSGAPVLHGRELIQQYRQLFPKSRAPGLAIGLVLAGLLSLLIGVAAEIAR